MAGCAVAATLTAAATVLRLLPQLPSASAAQAAQNSDDGTTEHQPALDLDAESGRRVDLRISVLPSTYGERVVLRLLDPSRSPHLPSFAGLGMPPEVERRYLAQVSKTSGIVLSPTGSGKTTSLYTTLAWARKLLPGLPDPRMNLALTLERAGRIDEAIGAYRAALGVYPGHIPSMEALASARLRQGRADSETVGLLEETALRGESER